MRVGFYGLIGYTAISTTLAWSVQLGLIDPPPRKAEAERIVNQEEKKVPISAEAFAENFAREYLLWTKGNEKSRRERLAPYLQPGLDPQAGLDLSTAEWDSWAQVVRTWSIDPGDQKDQMEATVYAQTVMTKGKERKRVDRWLKVRFQKAGDNYVVVNLPRFISPPETVPLDEEEEEEKQGETVDKSVHDAVANFLDSFWKIYTTGSPEEIRYLMKTDKVQGVEGLQYQEMTELEVYKDGENNFRAETEVAFVDLASQGIVTQHYILTLTREGTRWYVVNMDAN